MSLPGGSETTLLLDRLRTVHTALADAGFDHAIGGGIALAHWVSRPRFTADIDINVVASLQQVDRLLELLGEFVEVTEKNRDDLSDPDIGQARLFFPAPRTPLDVFLPQHPQYHELVTTRAVPSAVLDGIPVMTATDLTVFKVLFDRAKDWADIEAMLGHGHVETEEALTWLERIVGQDSRIDRLRHLSEITAATDDETDDIPTFKNAIRKPDPSP